MPASSITIYSPTTHRIMIVDSPLVGTRNHAFIEALQTCLVKPPIVEYNGRPVALFFEHKDGTSTGLRKMVYKTVLGEAKCRSCAEHARELASISTEDGHVFWPKDLAPQKEEHFTIIELTTAIAATPVTGLRVQVATPDVLGLPVCTSSKKHFKHYAMLVDPMVVPLSTINFSALHDAENNLLAMAFAHYLPVQMPKLIRDILGGGGTDGALASLTLLDTCLRESTNGDKAVHALRWMVRMMEHIRDLGGEAAYKALSSKQQWLLHAQFLLWTNISGVASGGDAVSPLFQQASKNLVSILQVATSKEAATALLTDRFAPTVYQRPTEKQLSGASICRTAAQLGEFSNWLLTRAELRAMPACVTLSSPTAYDKLMAVKKIGNEKAAGGAGAFARRCGVDGLRVDDISTVDDVVEFLRKHPRTVVEVLGMSTAYVVGTSLAPQFRSVPHFWAFVGGASGPHGAWVQVLDLLPIYEYVPGHHTIICTTTTPHPSAIGSNVCFPEFLHTAYRKECGQVFEALNRTLKLEMRAGAEGPYAYGAGTSAKNRDAEIIRPVTFRLNGSEVTVTKMFQPCDVCGQCVKRSLGASVHASCV